MLNFSPIQFVLLDLWPVKDNPCRTVPGGQKHYFPLAVFHENYNILKMLCHISLKTCSLLNLTVLDQNLMIKRDEFEWKLCCFDFSVRFRISKNSQIDHLPMEFWECGITDKVSKVVTFENTYLWVTFGKSFIFCIFMLIYLFLISNIL